MEEIYGNRVLNEVEKIISITKVPLELSSASWNGFVFDFVDLHMTNSKLKLEKVKVIQYYSRRWREHLPSLPVSASLPLYVGSYAEGMPNSDDCDVMYIAKWVFLFEDIRSWKDEGLPMSPIDCPPGYVRIRVPSAFKRHNNPPDRKVGRHRYLINSGYLELLQKWGAAGSRAKIHGPAMRDTTVFTQEFVHAIKIEKWPTFADDFFKRKRSRILPLDQIRAMESYVVATSKSNSVFHDLEWRLSFTNAEKFLFESWGNTEKFCYYMLKQFKIYYLSDQDIVCSYYLKTILYWMCEVQPPEFWCRENLMKSYVLALTLLTHFLRKGEMPNFFIPENNMIDHKDKDECKYVASVIEEKLNSGQMNVSIIETLNEDPIKYMFGDIGRDISICRPIRSNKAFQDCIKNFCKIGRSFQQRRLEQEAWLLSSLSISLAIWNQEQFQAMQDTLLTLKDTVSTEHFAPFSIILNRKLGDYLHKVGLRCSLRKAEEIYLNSVELVYPSGYNDYRISGTTRLALFYYLNARFAEAIGVLVPILPILQKVVESDQVENFLIESLPIYKVDRFWRDNILYLAVRNTTPENPIRINTIVLAMYIYIRCISFPDRALSTDEKSTLNKNFTRFLTLPEKIQNEDLLVSFNLLHQGLIPIIKERLHGFTQSNDFQDISNKSCHGARE